MITFFGMPSRSSGEIRGRQLAERLNTHHGEPNACFADTHNPDWAMVERAGNKVAILVRSYDRGLAEELKRRGFKVGYDLLDQMVGDAVHRGVEVKDLSAYAHKACDFFIVNNTAIKQDLEPHAGGRLIRVVPHHTPNHDQHINQLKGKVERVGYVGLPEQLSHRGDIERLCADHGAAFVSSHPNTREECDALLRTIDMGLVFAESDGNMRPHVVELMKRYKPNTKLSNFQSYGSPTICTPYSSYVEFSAFACRFVDTKDAMLTMLEELLTQPYARVELSNAAILNGRRFHIDEVLKLYKDIVRDLEVG